MAISTTNTAKLRHIASFKSSGTFKCPDGVTKIWVTAYGASGGNGGDVNGRGVSYGGGTARIGGAWVNVVPGQSYPVVIGAGAPQGFSGGSGGQTYFDGSVIANGGPAGGGQATMVYLTTLPPVAPSGAEVRVSGEVTSNTYIPGQYSQNSFTIYSWGPTPTDGRVEIFAV